MPEPEFFWFDVINVFFKIVSPKGWFLLPQIDSANGNSNTVRKAKTSFGELISEMDFWAQLFWWSREGSPLDLRSFLTM